MHPRLLTLATVVILASQQQAAVAQHHAPNPVVHFFFHLGLAGLFLVSIVDSSFVPLPLPGVTDIMLIVYAAAHSNPVLLVAIATAGSAVGGFVSHAVGQAGGMSFLERHVPKRILGRVTHWMESNAILSVALPAILPPPMPLSPFVLVAGAVCMSRRKFMTAFTLSRLARHAIAVWLGLRYGHAVLRLWSHFSERWATTILIALWTVILTFTGVAIWQLYKTSKQLELQPGARRTRKPVVT
jgi:membrane protein YqaA with SNARE-associated domain